MILIYLFVFIFYVEGHTSEINQFLKLSYENDPEIKRILNDKKSLQFFVDQGITGNEILLTAKTETGFVSDQDQNNSSVQAGISKQFITTGTEVAVTHSETFNNLEDGTSTSVSIEQSLLRDSFGSSTRLKIDSLEAEKEVKELESVEELEQYLLSILNKYLLYKKSYIILSLAEAQVKEAKKIHKNLVEKYKLKVATLADLNRGELLLVDREENLVLKKNEKDQYESELTSIAGASALKLLSKKEFDLLLEKLIGFYENNKGAVDKEKIRSYIIAKKNLDISQYTIDVLNDESSASLSLVVGFNREDTTRFSVNNSQDEAVVGFNLSIPFGDTQADANHSAAKVNKLSHYYKQKNTDRNFENSLDKLQASLATQSSKLKLNTRKVKLTRSLLNEEMKKYSIGQLSLEELIEIKYDLFNLENENAEIKTDYIYGLFNWLSETDNLIKVVTLL